jgi:diaminopimelate decarboxylase
MHDFTVRDEALFCESCRITDIIKKTGTPAYIYSAKTITDHFEKLRKAFTDYPTTICYSVKANSNVRILSLLAKQGSGADIVSGGELYRALAAGISPKKIVYSGVGKTGDEIKYAIETGVRFFNVESIPELYAINEIASATGRTAGISLRINPDIDAHTHHYTTTAKKENKFGLPISGIEEYYRTASQLPYVEVVGIDVHLGSPLLQIDPYLQALGLLKEALIRLRRNGISPRVLDLGGGLGIVYKDENAFSAQDFSRAVIPLVREMDLELIIEPGRFIVGNAGILVTRVTYVKKTPVKNFIIVDAGMNDLIRPPLYNSYHQVQALENTNRSTIMADVVGPICESADFFAKDRDVPEVRAGEAVAIMSAGAYGFSMSSNYNSRPRACEVLVQGSEFKIIRTRETYQDLIRGEQE